MSLNRVGASGSGSWEGLFLGPKGPILTVEWDQAARECEGVEAWGLGREEVWAASPPRSSRGHCLTGGDPLAGGSLDPCRGHG